MATRRKTEANRRNGSKGGPKTEKGKAVSCMNARTHGIFAVALTEYDSEELGRIHDELVEHMQPVGPVEGILVEKLAHMYVRLQRCARAEAEHHRITWKPSVIAIFRAEEAGRKPPELQFGTQYFRESVDVFMRYDRALTNQMLGLLHEIERLQRRRAGDTVQPPVAADLTIHVDDGTPTNPCDASDSSFMEAMDTVVVFGESVLRNEPTASEDVAQK